MEAAGVASIADSCGLPFYAVKCVSDEVGFPMPPMNDFVDAEGKLHMATYGMKMLLHPAWWRPTWRLARNGQLAAVELCRALEHQIEQFRKIEQGALKPQA
jgi:adenosylhomocysteine nucleosidase